MLQVLGVSSSNNDVDVVAELRSRLEAAGLVATSSSMTQNDDDAIATAVAAENAKHESTIAELKKTNESLKTKLRTVFKSNQDAKHRHAKDVAKLQKTVDDLRQQRAKERETAIVERTEGRPSAGADVGTTSANSSSGVVLPPVSVASPQTRPPPPNPPAATFTGDQGHRAAVHMSVAQASPSSVVMPPLALPRNSPTTTPRTVPPTTAVILPNLAIDNSAYQTDDRSTTLRGQVC